MGEICKGTFKNMGTKVAVAGHFNPIHPGHLLMIEEATKLGDYLVVIVANDIQAQAKRPKVFMPIHDRMMIMSHIKGVNEVVASIDTDSSIKNTLKMVKPDILASGCEDTHPDALEEKAICDKLNIKTIYNVGGGKIHSSSTLLQNYAN